MRLPIERVFVRFKDLDEDHAGADDAFAAEAQRGSEPAAVMSPRKCRLPRASTRRAAEELQPFVRQRARDRE